MTGRAPACFQEADPGLALWRRALAEGVGTLLLMLAATGAGLASQKVLAPLPGLTLPVLAIVVAAALAGLIVTFGEVSGGHFNPLITLLQWMNGERTGRCTLAYIVAQLKGAIAGAFLANLLWHAPAGTPVIALSYQSAASELVAAAGLMLVVFGCARSNRPETAPFAVAAWLLAAIVATPSTSYANPAIALAGVIARGPLALSPAVASVFIAAELMGALLALGLTRFFHHQKASVQ